MSIPAGDPNSLISQLTELDSLVEGYHNNSQTNKEIERLVGVILSELYRLDGIPRELVQPMTKAFTDIQTHKGHIGSDFSVSCLVRGFFGWKSKTLTDLELLSNAMRSKLLQDAASRGDIDFIRTLLANGAVISEADRGRAVAAATQGCHEACIQALLANGAISKDDIGIAVIAAARGGS